MITVLAKMMRHVPIVREATSASAQPALKEKIVGKVKGPIFYVTDVGPKAVGRININDRINIHSPWLSRC